MSVRDGIGGNAPPPHVAHEMHVEDLFALANSITTIETAEQEAIADQLLDDLRAAKKAADESRKAEAKPFDDGKAEVQERYKPILSRADVATNALKALLTPYRAAQAARAENEARNLREAAEKAANGARAAFQSDDLDDRLAAEELLAQARKQNVAANKIDRAATGLRTSWEAEITDVLAFGKWAWQNHREQYLEFLNTLAANEARGSRRVITGLTYHAVKKAA